MNPASLAVRVVNRVLQTAGVRLARVAPEAPTVTPTNEARGKYHTLVREMHDCYAAIVFDGLEDVPGRIDLLARLVGTPVPEALYIISSLAKTREVPGDVCEFGVAQGATSALMANEIRATTKSLFLFDSFQGLGKPTPEDVLIDDIFELGSIERYEGTMKEPAERVQERLRDIGFDRRRVQLVPGFIEQTIGGPGLPSTVSFAYVDMDFYRPVLLSLDFLAAHLSVGGIVLVDDYGFFSSGAKTAVDEFMGKHAHDFAFSLPHPFAAQTTPFCILTRTR